MSPKAYPSFQILFVKLEFLQLLVTLKKHRILYPVNNRKCAILVDKTLRKYDIEIKHIDGSVNEVSRFIM